MRRQDNKKKREENKNYRKTIRKSVKNMCKVAKYIEGTNLIAREPQKEYQTDGLLHGMQKESVVTANNL